MCHTARLTLHNGSALATTMHELERDKAALASHPDNLKVIFKEMIQMCLWCVGH